MLPRRLIRGRSSACRRFLSPEEVARLINAAELPFYRILFMTLYGTRARRAEVAHLKVGDNRCPAIANPGTLKLANRSTPQVASNWTRHSEPEAEAQIAISPFRAISIPEVIL